MKGQDGSILNDNQNVIKPQVSIVLVPFPAQGHLNQLLHLSYLISSYDIPVHFTGSPSHNRQAKHRLHGWHRAGATQQDDVTSLVNNIHFHDFELPPYDSPPPNPNSTMHFPSHLIPLWKTSLSLREPLFELVKKMSSECQRVVVIYDTLMPYVVQDVKNIVNVESFCFFPGCAFTLFLGLYDIMNQTLPFEIDCDIVPMSKVPSNDGTSTDEMEEFYNEKVAKYSGLETGSLYNTSRVIEGKYLELVERITNKKCFAIGPVNPVQIAKNERDAQRHRCLEWLDKQEKDSVIYVSFGTMTSITDEQIEELAIGLEKSCQKFIWVLRDADKGDVFTENGTVRKLKLPDGYEERVKDRGIIVREWAPQLEILAHESTGGFLSHCGWNSCMESISMGVPIATWPMHSDQPRNAILVTEVLRIGTVVKDWARRGEVVSSGDVQRAVTRLMGSEEGVEMRERVAKLGEDVRQSINVGGGSRLEMDYFIAHIKR